MDMFTKWLSRNLHIPLGISGVAFCLSMMFFTGSLLSQQAPSLAEDGTLDQSGKAPVETTPQQWTILCEREDGTQGVFRISSKLTNTPSPLEPALPAEIVPAQEHSPQEMKEESPAIDEDPFGNPTLKCGRLLTLLAFFGSAETSNP